MHRPLLWPSIIADLRAHAAGMDAPLYLVGGTVRDAVLGRPLHDIDLATPGDGVHIARRLADALGGTFYPLDRARGVGRAIVGSGAIHIDVARFRGETLETDLRARDFTINAAAVDLTGDLQCIIDPLGGLDDLIHKRLRLCAPGAIVQDPTRALRAVRQSMAFSLHMDPAAREAVRRDGPGIVRVSAERVRDELMSMLGGPRPDGALRVLDALGLLDLIVPEVAPMRGMAQSYPHALTLWEHVLAVVKWLDAVLGLVEGGRKMEQAGLAPVLSALHPFRDGLRDHLAQPWPDGRTTRSLMMLSALLHDVGKPQTRTADKDGRLHFFGHDQIGVEMAQRRAQALRLSRDEVRRVGATVRYHMRPMMLANDPKVTGRAIFRFFRDARESGVDVCLLTLADYLGTAGAVLDLDNWQHYIGVVLELLDGYYKKHHKVVAPPSLLTGTDLKRELGLPQGPAIGRVLRAVQEAQAAGEIDTREEALAFARTQLEG